MIIISDAHQKWKILQDFSALDMITTTSKLTFWFLNQVDRTSGSEVTDDYILEKRVKIWTSSDCGTMKFILFRGYVSIMSWHDWHVYRAIIMIMMVKNHSAKSCQVPSNGAWIYSILYWLFHIIPLKVKGSYNEW